jgi:hypothetical protein
VQSKIELNGSSEQSDMKIEVTMDNCHFDLNVRCVITQGELKIEIYDEKGKNRAVFPLEVWLRIKLLNLIQI